MFNRIMEYDGRGEYVKLIHDDPTLFEMGAVQLYESIGRS